VTAFALSRPIKLEAIYDESGRCNHYRRKYSAAPDNMTLVPYCGIKYLHLY